MNIDFTESFNGFITDIAYSLVRVIVALAVLFVSFKLIRFLTRKIENLPRVRAADKTVSKILIYAVSLSLRALVILALISYVGVDTGGITAILASLGVGVGLAVNGTLSNLAGGFLIIITRPFKIDDFISAQGYDGTVEDIRIIYTKLVTPDNKVIYIPNGALSGGNILNYSEKEKRRLDLSFPLTNSTDVALATKIVEDAVKRSGYFYDEPQSSVRIKSFGEEGVTLFLRAWLNSKEYWSAYYDITEAVRAGFVSAGLTPPERHINVRLLEIKNDKNGYQSKN